MSYSCPPLIRWTLRGLPQAATVAGMAKIVDAIPARVDNNGRHEAHPWDEWLDGQVRELVAGEDFAGTPRNMARSIRRAAAARGVTVTTRTERTHDVSGGVLWLQAHPEPSQATSSSRAERRARVRGGANVNDARHNALRDELNALRSRGPGHPA
jgi:hypothetical protein